MTEKRYYTRDFEELYYIIDSEVISEAEFDDKYLYEGYSAFEESLTGEEIVELLNENEELKKELSDLRKENYGNLDGLAYKDEVEIPKLSERISDLECENEQLKKENSKHIVDYNGLNCEYGWLKEENEQLNSRIRYLENKIQRERNATTNQHLRWSDEAETKIKELSKENEELREQVKCLLEDLQSTNQINKEIVDDVREELLKENEQLKMQLRNTCDQRDEFHRGARENANRVGKLEKENEQLKSEKVELLEENITYKNAYLAMKDYEKENEQLKLQNKQYSMMVNANHDLNDEIYEQLQKTEKNYKFLLEENEQLKKENSKHIMDYNGLNCEYGWLKEENEELKQYKQAVRETLLSWSQKNLTAKELGVVIAIMEELNVDIKR